MEWLGTQFRSTSHSVSKVSTFTHHNKLTSRIVSKPLMGLTTLNQALICTLTPNLMGVIWSESMISQAFQACYSIEGCLSDCRILSQERVGYMVVKLLPTQPLTKITSYTLKRIVFTTSRVSEMKARAKETLPINLYSEKYIKILQILGLNYKRKKKETPHPTLLPFISVTNFIWPYLHQFFDDSHGLNGYRKPLKRPFDQYQSRLKEISIGWDIRQINW